MKILAVSDTHCRSLEDIVSSSPEKLKDIGIIVSCGDLDRPYIEFLADGLSKELFFVCGNHSNDEELGLFSEKETFADTLDVLKDVFEKKVVKRIAGSDDMHGRMEIYGDYIIVGFEGSKRYNGKKNQYTEKEMCRVVRKTIRKIRIKRLYEKVFRKKQKEIIVISHAPILNIHDLPDPCHTGFKCFEMFLKKVSPLLWIHGHIHLDNIWQNQVTLVEKTTVINAFGCKIISIDHHKIEVSSHLNLTNKEVISNI